MKIVFFESMKFCVVLK